MWHNHRCQGGKTVTSVMETLTQIKDLPSNPKGNSICIILKNLINFTRFIHVIPMDFVASPVKLQHNKSVMYQKEGKLGHG